MAASTPRTRTVPAAAARGRIVVAMSGGVDSAVAAALLKEAGHDVVGVTLQLYNHAEATTRRGSCCAGQDIHDARRVADRLEIPHYVLDYEDRFRDAVITPFADSYLRGETPIPCVACNSRIKFRDLLDTARELGAEALATGHYVQRRDGPGGPALHCARDSDRDQSYFMFATTRPQLEQLRFPLGALTKHEVRARAAELGLPVADKPDSQDICFVPTGSYARVIERLRPDAVEGGDIVHVDGRVLGRHRGTVHFTVGQRKGIGVAASEPLYVVGIDAARRRVVVGSRRDLHTTDLTLRELNWLGEGSPPMVGERGLDVQVKVRSSQVPRPARIWSRPDDGGAEVELIDGEHGVAPGQACVVYADAGPEARVLGGGWIARRAANDVGRAAAGDCMRRAVAGDRT